MQIRLHGYPYSVRVRPLNNLMKYVRQPVSILLGKKSQDFHRRLSEILNKHSMIFFRNNFPNVLVVKYRIHS